MTAAVGKVPGGADRDVENDEDAAALDDYVARSPVKD